MLLPAAFLYFAFHIENFTLTFFQLVIYHTKYWENVLAYVKSLLVLQNFSTARKSGNILTYWKLFSTDTRQSMKRRITSDG